MAVVDGWSEVHGCMAVVDEWSEVHGCTAVVAFLARETSVLGGGCTFPHSTKSC
jgi:hypothetical protein